MDIVIVTALFSLLSTLHPSSYSSFSFLCTEGKPKELRQVFDHSEKEKKQKQAVEQDVKEENIKRENKDDRTFKDNQLKNFRADRQDRESPEQELERLKREDKKRKEELAGKEAQYKNRRLNDSTDRPNFHTSSHKVPSCLRSSEPFFPPLSFHLTDTLTLFTHKYNLAYIFPPLFTNERCKGN